MKRPDFSSVKLSELFSLENTPLQFQVDLWKKSLSASAVFFLLSGALATAVGLNQDDGGYFDFHDDAQAYVERAAFTTIDKNTLQVETMKRADDAERNRMAILLSLTLLSGIGAGYSYKKLKTAQEKLTP